MSQPTDSFLKAKERANPSGLGGFSLVEVLISVAAIAALAGGALLMISGSIKSAREQKLATDVVTINAALVTFIANGGDLSDANTAAEVIERIKTRAEEDQIDQMVGLRSGFLDPRVTVVDQDATEAESTAARAYWNPNKKRFVVKYNGAVGIKEFVLDESKADALETEHQRKTTVKFSNRDDDTWVWEYAEHGMAVAPGPMDLTPVGTVVTGLGLPVVESAVPLNPPTVSVPGDTYPIADYDGLEVTLEDPNPAGVSELFYSVVPGVWEKYVDPIPIDPGTDLETQAVSIDSDRWSDSETTLDPYRTTPVKLEIALANANSSYDYVTLGGALEPGDYATPGLVQPAAVSFLNASVIPSQYVNSGVFNVYWTLDGSDPAASANAFAGESFSGSFPDQPIWFSLDDWGPDDVLQVQVCARSYDTAIVTSSDPVSAILRAIKIQMRPPLIDLDPASDLVTLSLQSDFGDTPLGSRIVFTTDGSDPGIGPDGDSVVGTLYVEPFSASLAVSEIKARAYAPLLYQHWFDVSDLATANFSPPPEETAPNVLVAMSVEIGP